jgi:hypothetical protein
MILTQRRKGAEARREKIFSFSFRCVSTSLRLRVEGECPNLRDSLRRLLRRMI